MAEPSGNAVSRISLELQDDARRLWQDTELSASAIGAQLGTTKNTVLGLAHRRGWGLRGVPLEPEPTTLGQRMDALNATMDAVLRENPPGRGRIVIEKSQPIVPAGRSAGPRAIG